MLRPTIGSSTITGSLPRSTRRPRDSLGFRWNPTRRCRNNVASRDSPLRSIPLRPVGQAAADAGRVVADDDVGGPRPAGVEQATAVASGRLVAEEDAGQLPRAARVPQAAAAVGATVGHGPAP